MLFCDYTESMNVRLDPRGEHLVEEEIRAGRYHSPEEVVARALETLVEREALGGEPGVRHQAVLDMLKFAEKHRFTLGHGLRIKDLLREGHKY